jgi:hypothetical protein
MYHSFMLIIKRFFALPFTENFEHAKGTLIFLKFIVIFGCVGTRIFDLLKQTPPQSFQFYTLSFYTILLLKIFESSFNYFYAYVIIYFTKNSKNGTKNQSLR